MKREMRLPSWLQGQAKPAPDEKRVVPTFQRSTRKTKPGAVHKTKWEAPIQSFRVAVTPSCTLALDEELMLLAGMEKLALQHPNIKLGYTPRDPAILPLIKSAWFLHQLPPPLVMTKWTEWIPVTVALPNVDIVRYAEEDIYRQEFDKRVAGIKRQQEAIEEQGMKDVKIPVPHYAFNPSWNKGSALLWALSQEIGLPVEVDGALRPYNRIPRELERSVFTRLQQKGIGSRPFLVYDFQPESESSAPTDDEVASLLSVLESSVSDTDCVAFETLWRLLGESVTNLFVAMRHPNLLWYVGGCAFANCAAAAGRVPHTVYLDDSEDPVWNSPQFDRMFRIQRSVVPKGQMPLAVQQAIHYLYQPKR